MGFGAGIPLSFQLRGILVSNPLRHFEMQCFPRCLTRNGNKNDNFWNGKYFSFLLRVRQLENWTKSGQVSDYFWKWNLFSFGMMKKSSGTVWFGLRGSYSVIRYVDAHWWDAERLKYIVQVQIPSFDNKHMRKKISLEPRDGQILGCQIAPIGPYRLEVYTHTLNGPNSCGFHLHLFDTNSS